MHESQIPEHLAQLTHNPQAFLLIYDYFYPRVFAYVAYRVGRVEDAEDIVAEVFIKVVTHIQLFEYRGAGSFSAWLFRIAYNELQNFYQRNRQPSQELSINDLPDIQSETLPVEVMVQLKEKFAYLRKLINQLPPRRQEIINLKFFGELRNKEIAEILGLDERTIASHLSRALNDLRTAYTDETIQEVLDHV